MGARERGGVARGGESVGSPAGLRQRPPSLYEAFRAGGVVRLDEDDLNAALSALADQLAPVYQGGRAELLGRLRTQGANGFLNTRGGVAVTHPRRPLVLPVSEPTILVALLDEPIHGASALFTVVSPSVADQCATLARLSRLLADPKFLRLLNTSQPDEAILDFVWLHDCGLSDETIEIPIDLLD